jgi:hypothetical protein
MPPDFLNSREDAILLWVIITVGYLIYKDPKRIGGGFLGVFRVGLTPKLLVLFGAAVLYSAVIVYGAKEADVWHTSALKATVYWFIGTAVVLVAYAIARPTGNEPDFLRKVLTRVIGVTIVLEFVVNVYALPFVYELALLPVLLVLLVVQSDASGDPRVRRLSERVIAAVGLLYLAYVFIKALGNLDGFLTRENAEDFLVGPALTIALIPFLYVVAWLSLREQRTLRERLRPG